jgi:FtsZ-binding cell division protein ZapB
MQNYEITNKFTKSENENSQLKISVQELQEKNAGLAQRVDDIENELVQVKRENEDFYANDRF